MDIKVGDIALNESPSEKEGKWCTVAISQA